MYRIMQQRQSRPVVKDRRQGTTSRRDCPHLTENIGDLRGVDNYAYIHPEGDKRCPVLHMTIPAATLFNVSQSNVNGNTRNPELQFNSLLDV